MWYSLVVAFITVVFGYIPVGLGLPIYIVLPISIAATVLSLYILGKPIEETKGNSVVEKKAANMN